MRLLNKNFLLSYLNSEYRHYPVYVNLSYWWNFGVLSFLFLGIQFITGIFLAMHYIPSSDLAFISIEHIMRDVNYGWVIRYIHANGASFFFLMVYIHMARGLYFSSYLNPREFVWVIGVLILLLMIITAFLGYVLPWGQMSFWAATVITNLFTAIPIFGQEIVVWLWGGYSVDHATLNRFLSLHYLLPFVIIFLVLLHVIFLHEQGSSNPVNMSLLKDKIMFNPYYTVKDLYSVIIILMLFSGIIGFWPDYLGHADNYIMANPLVTPAHIVPEWYFLPFYAILRSIPNKLGGIVVLFLAILVLLILPFLVDSRVSVVNFNSFRMVQQFLFWCFVMLAIFLGWLGGNPVEEPYLFLGQLFTCGYFYYLCFLNLCLIHIDFIVMLNRKIVNKSIAFFVNDFLRALYFITLIIDFCVVFLSCAIWYWGKWLLHFSYNILFVGTGMSLVYILIVFIIPFFAVWMLVVKIFDIIAGAVINFYKNYKNKKG